MTSTLEKRKSLFLAFGWSLLYFSLGFALLHYGWVTYGLAFFVLLPVITGVFIGILPNYTWSMIGVAGCMIFATFGMITMGLEGILCGVMALGLMLPLVFLGALVSFLWKRYSKSTGTTKLNVMVMPLVIFLAAVPFEKKATTLNEVRSVIVLPYTPEQVYNAIKSVDTLDVAKTSLMYIGLPVPHKCILDSEAVGATRTCYFDGGKIVERTTEVERGKILRMVVTDYKLTGRKWLGFKDALYTFESAGNGHTRMTRVTTYTSELLPRWYWEPMEKWGIRQEHDYVFRNLQKDLLSTKSR